MMTAWPILAIALTIAVGGTMTNAAPPAQQTTPTPVPRPTAAVAAGPLVDVSCAGETFELPAEPDATSGPVVGFPLAITERVDGYSVEGVAFRFHLGHWYCDPFSGPANGALSGIRLDDILVLTVAERGDA